MGLLCWRRAPASAAACQLRTVSIRSFAGRATKRFAKGDRRSLPPRIAAKLEDLLSALRLADSPDELDLPGARLHALKGNRKGFFAVELSARWRLVFRFKDGDAYDVEVVDYHPS